MYHYVMRMIFRVRGKHVFAFGYMSASAPVFTESESLTKQKYCVQKCNIMV